VVLLPQTGHSIVTGPVADRILAALAKPMIFDGAAIPTSASIGISQYPEHGSTWQTAFKAADLALYEAQRKARGRWQLHTGGALLNFPGAQRFSSQ
jgi:GGDEF domain-containing protein